MLLKRPHPHPERKLLVLCTTSSFTALRDLQMKPAFNVILSVPLLQHVEQVRLVLSTVRFADDRKTLDEVAKCCVLPIGIKQLLMVIEMATQDNKPLTPENFSEALDNSGLTLFSQKDIDSMSSAAGIE